MSGISVVIPTRNRPEQLIDAVASALRIVLVDEVLVIDDGSAPAIGMQLFDDLNALADRIVIRRNAHIHGAQGARMTGALSAKNSIVLFLDSDDVLVERGVTEVFETLARDQSLAMAYANVAVGDKVSDFLRIRGDGFRVVLKNLSLCPFSGLMIRRDLIPWTTLDLTLPAWQDDDFCLSVCKTQKVTFVDAISARMVTSADSISRSKQRQLIGLLLLISKWRDDLLREFGTGRLFLWRLRVLAILFLVVSQDFRTMRDRRQGKGVVLIALSTLFKAAGVALRGTIRPFFDRIYS